MSHGGGGGGEEGGWGFAKGMLVLVGHSVGATMGLKMLLGGFGTGSERVKAVVSLAGIADFVALRDAHLELRGPYDGFCTAAFGEEEGGGWELGRVFSRRGVWPDGQGGEDVGAGVMETDGGLEEAGVEVVVLGQGRADELVEWDQVEILRDGLRSMGWEEEEAEAEEKSGMEKWAKEGVGGKQSESSLRGGVQSRRKRRRMAVVELEGGHDDVWGQGKEIARCVELAIEMLFGREGGSEESGIQ